MAGGWRTRSTDTRHCWLTASGFSALITPTPSQLGEPSPYVAESGRLAEAIAQQEALLVDCERSDSESQLCWTTRNNLASALQDAGRTAEAIVQIRHWLPMRSESAAPSTATT